MDDLISRKALMKKIAHHTVHDSMSCVTFERSTVYEMVKGDMFGLVKDAPAVAAMPRWISVEERLPKGNVLAVNDRGTMHIGHVEYYKNGGFKVCICEDYDSSISISNVTHWMPLPEPPKED